MPDAPIARAKISETAPCAVPLSSLNVQALTAHRAAMAVAAAFAQALDDLVFIHPISHDPKIARAYRRLLSSHQALSFFQLIWKKSSFVTDAELEAASLPRNFPGMSLNAHRLAIELAETPAEVGASIKRVSSLLCAGVAYGLVDEQRLGPKKIVVSGSALLHKVMLSVASGQEAILEPQRDTETTDQL